MISRLFLALTSLAIIQCQASAGSRHEQPEYPGASAFSALDEYLAAHAQEPKSVQSDLELIGDLLRKFETGGNQSAPASVKPDRAIEAARLVLALEEAAKEGECDADTNLLVRHNFMGTIGGRNKFDFHDEDQRHLEMSRLAAAVNELTLRLVVHCERNIATTLAKALDQMPMESRDTLELFLSEEFVDEHKRLSKVAPFYGVMDARLEPYGRQEFARGPLVLIIDQFFKLTDMKRGKPPTVGSAVRTSALWPKVARDELEALLQKYLLGPCAEYLGRTRLGVFEIFHWIRGYMSYKSYDPRKLIAKQSGQFKHQLFRYDFCNLYHSSQARAWFWEEYSNLLRKW